MIDRTSGEVLKADAYSNLNWAKGIDMKTGRPIVDAEKEPKLNETANYICPTSTGFKNWQPASFSPKTGYLYMGIQNICMDLGNRKVGYIAGTRYDGMEVENEPAKGVGNNWGSFFTWDPVAGKRAWTIREEFIVFAGALGGRAGHGRRPHLLRHQRRLVSRHRRAFGRGALAAKAIVGQPMAYLGPDGRQYIAIAAGIGGQALSNQEGRAGMPARGSNTYVFSLDGERIEAEANVSEPEQVR